MLKCTCGEKFESYEGSMEHIRRDHADDCDNCLQEYVEDSIRDAHEELISGEEE